MTPVCSTNQSVMNCWLVKNITPLTVIVVSGEVLPVDEEVVVLVQLPELAVDHVEVLVAEELCHLITNQMNKGKKEKR